VSVVAPPGYGKTTLLSQWAERNGQAFAWVSVDEAAAQPGQKRVSQRPLSVRSGPGRACIAGMSASTRSQAVTQARQLGLLDG
jgi:ATP/maltotriose-dependent transcriptional regulator MalT